MSLSAGLVSVGERRRPLLVSGNDRDDPDVRLRAAGVGFERLS